MLSRLKPEDSFHHLCVSRGEQMETELRKLSQAERCQIHAWLDDLIEDELEFTPNSKARSSRPNAIWSPRRVRGCVSLKVRERGDENLVRDNCQDLHTDPESERPQSQH
jgi:hypothetical protein